ncbi:hypothetical protein MMPV_000238 [Pyropia vietnamensis]
MQAAAFLPIVSPCGRWQSTTTATTAIATATAAAAAAARRRGLSLRPPGSSLAVPSAVAGVDSWRHRWRAAATDPSAAGPPQGWDAPVRWDAPLTTPLPGWDAPLDVPPPPTSTSRTPPSPPPPPPPPPPPRSSLSTPSLSSEPSAPTVTGDVGGTRTTAADRVPATAAASAEAPELGAAAKANPAAAAVAADPVAAKADLPYPYMAFADHAAFTSALQSLSDDPLAATGSRMVPGRGPPDARLMIVGEAPGAAEDAAGAPFVGPSGQLLDAILTAAGLDPATDMYVTNVVKRRPPNNRDPTAAEVAWYRPWLVEEVRLVAPLAMMVLGRVAARAVTGDTRPLSAVRGVWQRWEEVGEGVWLLPAYHPSYLLRNPTATVGGPKALMWDDIREVARVLRGGHVEEGRTYQGPGVP